MPQGVLVLQSLREDVLRVIGIHSGGGRGWEMDAAARVWEEVGGGRTELRSMGSLLREGGCDGWGGENRPMSVVGNFVRIGKVSGSFVTNKLK
jgi:hypothetical protein